MYKGNDTATPTPATDGKNFYIFFPDFGLASYTNDGKERWQLKLGPFKSFYGVSSSPILHGNTLLLVCDQESGSFMIALDKDTGRLRWRKERTEAKYEAFRHRLYGPQTAGSAGDYPRRLSHRRLCG